MKINPHANFAHKITRICTFTVVHVYSVVQAWLQTISRRLSSLDLLLLQGPGSVPVVKCLLEEEEELTLVDDHFSVPVSSVTWPMAALEWCCCMVVQDGRVDQLQRPRHFPEPVTAYTIRELSITWHLYGGRDFPSNSPSSSPHLQRTGLSSIGTKKLSVSSPPSQKIKGAGSVGRKGKVSQRGKEQETSGWKLAGGAGRDHSVLMEVELSKVQWWRFAWRHQLNGARLDGNKCGLFVV